MKDDHNYVTGTAQTVMYSGFNVILKTDLRSRKFAFFRDGMERAPYMYGLMEMEEMKMIVLQMAMFPVYTPSLLGLLEWMVATVPLMSNVLPKWLWLM